MDDIGTLSSTNKSKSTDKPKNASWETMCMEGHNRLVSLPFEGERHAAANPASNKKYGEALDYYKDLNEGSFKTEILRSIVKSDFEVELEPATETSEAVYGPSDGWNRGLRAQYNQCQSC
ncbi:hypothetical protein BDR22DRAFT_821505 [Usnea florida]